MEKINKIILDKNRSRIVKKLENDEDYYGDYGKMFLSNSDIGKLINNPKTYGIKTSENINLLFGKAFHELIMFGKTEFNEYVDASTRSTKLYKNAVENSGNEMIFLAKEYDELHRLVEVALSNENVRDVIKNKKNKFEVPNIDILTDRNIYWKGKADIIGECIYDIKTTSNLNKFVFSSRLYNYDSQAYIYSRLFQLPMKFIVVEKGTGCVGIFETSDDAYERGKNKVEQAEVNYVKYFKNKEFDINNHTTYGEI